MKLLFFTTIFSILTCCGSKKDSDSINLIVMEEGDTLSYFNYKNESLKMYNVYDRHSQLDSVILNKEAQSKIDGDFVFGIKNRTNPLNSFLMFRGVSPSKFKISEEPQTVFLDEEFNIPSDYFVVLKSNYIDSIGFSIRKIETQAAIDKLTKDTILFQDVIYAFRDNDFNEVLVSLVIYNNQKVREEMRLLVNDAVETMKRSTLDNNKNIDFKYKVTGSGILIENYEPVTLEELNRYLIKVNDVLKMDTLNVFLQGENAQLINPGFKKIYYGGWAGKMDLKSFQNDTTRALKNVSIHFGTFKGNEFLKNDEWDKKLLNNRFLKSVNN